MSLSDWLRGLFESIDRRPAVWLVATVLVLGAAIWGASQLRLAGDLSRLLPETAPSVRNLERLEAVYGDRIGRLTVVLDGAADPKSRRDTAERLAARLDALEGVDRASATNPLWELRGMRLLYLSRPDLQSVAERIETRVRWERQRANPLFVDLAVGEEAEPPPVDLSDIEARYRAGVGGTAEVKRYYESSDGQILVFVHPQFPASDLDRTTELLQRVRATTAETLAEAAEPMSFALTGRYEKRVEQQEIMVADIARATALATLLLTLFLLVYFRSPTSVVQVITPLAAGTVSGMALAAVIFGDLNILTGFLGAVLLGLGVDYGIHLVSRYHDLRRIISPIDALVEAYGVTGKANVYAGITTMAALGSLAVSDFRAFFEFGIIAVVGIACILLSYLLFLPQLILLRERLPGRPPAPLATTMARQAAKGATGRRLRRIGLFILVAVAALGALGAPQIHLDQSFRSLSIRGTEAWHLDRLVNEILGASQTPAVVPVEDPEHARRVVETLRERKARGGPGRTIDVVLSRHDLIPDEQPEKIAILRRLAEAIEPVPEAARSARLRELDAMVRSALEAAPVTLAEMPREVTVPFSRRDRPEASVVLVLPAVDLDEAEALRAFAQVLRDLPGARPGETIDATSESVLMADILTLVARDTVWMVGLTLFGLLLCVFIAFRGRREAFYLLGTLGVGVAGAVGVMGLAGVEFNFINLLVLPIWLGLGVDASFHLILHAFDPDHGPEATAATAVSISAAFITSMIGFGSMTLAHHAGLSSLGAAAICGLSAVLLASLGLAAWTVDAGDGSAPPLAMVPDEAGGIGGGVEEAG